MLGNLPYCIFSFGGGVQSSAIYLMLLHEPNKLHAIMGEIPDKVYFADTGAETQSTYDCIEFMKTQRTSLFNIEVVDNGNITSATFADGDYKPSFPFFIKQTSGKPGMAQRMCTTEYKIRAIQKTARKAFKLEKIQLRVPTFSVWLGISTDEKERMKFNEGEAFVNRYPLIELGMSRDDCLDYCAKYKWTPAKSRCWLCPYQSDVNWIDLKENHPIEFEKACVMDEKIRNTLSLGRVRREKLGLERDDAESYLHRSCKPLREVNFKRADTKDLFDDDCQGICGI